MTRVMSKGYNDSVTLEQRTQTLEQLSRQRWEDAEKGTPAYGPPYERAEGRRGAVPGRLPRLLQDAARLPSARGELGNSWTVTNPLSFMNMPILTYIKEISPRPVLFDPRREGPFALLQRDRLCGGRRAEGAHDHPRRQPHRSLRPGGRDPLRQAPAFFDQHLSA